MEDPPKPKRQLFKRPAWAHAPAAAATAISSSETDVAARTSTPVEDDIFNRSAQSYAEILAEKERKKRARAAKAAEKESRRNSDLQRVDSGSRDGVDGSVKRRRITDEDYKAFGLESPVLGRTEKVDEGNVDADSDDSPAKRPAVKVRTGRVASKIPTGPVIELGDSEDEERSETRAKGSDAPAEVEDDSDEEFPELVAAARERRRLRDLEQAQPTAPVVFLSASLAREESQPTPPPAPDPVVELLVTSNIPNTNPLLVRRRLTKRLQEVREAWCSKQGFTPEFSASVFLIYKMRRLYDVTTCKSLGLEVDSEGRILRQGGAGENLFDTEEDAARVHVQAVTADLFEELKKDKQRQLEKKAQSQSFETIAPAPEEPAAEDRLIKVILRAKGYDDFRLKVRPHTSFFKMMNAFRKEHKLPEEAQVSLYFDGDMMQPDDVMKDTEIEDTDCIDVVIK